MQVALIDHYDSFTFNVIDWLAAGDPMVEVIYLTHDDDEALARLRRNPLPLVLSPGPGRPEDAPGTLAVVRELLGVVPILGICLGHQMLAHVTGGKIVRSLAPMHGTTRNISISPSEGLLSGLGGSCQVAVYNSLIVDADTLDSTWEVNGICEKGEIQAISRQKTGEAPAFGIQFHPESFMSQGRETIRRNWLRVLQS